MDASLTVPTATSVRSVPVTLLIDNRIVINNHVARGGGGGERALELEGGPELGDADDEGQQQRDDEGELHRG